jgi:hypothetical protein
MSFRVSAAGGAVHDHGFVAIERLIVRRTLRIGAKLQHAAGNVLGALNLSGRLYFGAVTHIDHQGLAALDQGFSVLRADGRNRAVGRGQHLFH